MFRVILTGGIASGKTEATNYLKDFGVEIIDADEIGKKLVAAGQPAFLKICSIFGENIVMKNGELDRKAIRKKVFFNTEYREKLQDILHPIIHQEIIKISKESTSDYIIIVLPLFIESKEVYDYEKVLLIEAAEDIRKSRLKKRENISSKEINQILKIQASDLHRKIVADDILLNNSSLNDLKKGLNSLHKKYLDLAKKNVD
tara:strand:+ start:2074 stop:2679 length:606 start_codon:yes stop_codon:yes gene_type:complete